MRPRRSAQWIGVVALFAYVASSSGASDGPVTQKQLDEVRQQNQQLQQEITRQRQLLEELQKKLSAVERNSPPAPPAESAESPMTRKAGGGFSLGKVNLGMEGGLAFFRSESAGSTPNAEFRIDEARLFLEANVWKDVYVFSEISLATREDAAGGKYDSRKFKLSSASIMRSCGISWSTLTKSHRKHPSRPPNQCRS